jgi:hypothetical protein
MGTDWASSLGVKWPGRDADPSPPSSIEVMNEWSYMSTPPIYLPGVDMENFTLLYFKNP